MSKKSLGSWGLYQLQPYCNLFTFEEQSSWVWSIKNCYKLIVGWSVLYNLFINQNKIACEKYEWAAYIFFLWVSAILSSDDLIFNIFIAFSFLIFVRICITWFENKLNKIVERIELSKQFFWDNKNPEISCNLMFKLFRCILVDIFYRSYWETLSLVLLIW